MMHKPVSHENYKDDPLYRRVVNAVRHLHQNKGEVTPLNVLLTLGMLKPAKLLEWRQGRIPFLEAVLSANLSITNRVLRILRLHSHDIGMKDAKIEYTSIGRQKNLQFSRAADPNIERAYCRIYKLRVRPAPPASPEPTEPALPVSPASPDSLALTVPPAPAEPSEPTAPRVESPPDPQGS